MNDPRQILLAVGTEDVAGVASACLQTVQRLAVRELVAPVVCGPAGVPLRHARALGLPTVQLPSMRWPADSVVSKQLSTSDLVHVVGVEAARLLNSARDLSRVPAVISVDSLRHRLAARVLSRRARGHDVVRWLVHGRRATMNLIQTHRARPEHVVTLPVLPFAADDDVAWLVARNTARQALALTPGRRAVFGFGPVGCDGFHALRKLHRGGAHRSLATVWVDTGQACVPRGDALDDVMIVGPDDGRNLLPAMDVFVADGTLLAARHPVVDAALVAVPIVTTEADLAVDSVMHSVNGYVCMASELPEAVAAAVEMGIARGLHRRLRNRRRPLFGDPLETTARCYEDALGRPLVRPALMGRGIAR